MKCENNKTHFHLDLAPFSTNNPGNQQQHNCLKKKSQPEAAGAAAAAALLHCIPPLHCYYSEIAKGLFFKPPSSLPSSLPSSA